MTAGRDLMLLYRARDRDQLVLREELDALVAHRQARVVYLLGSDPDLLSARSLARMVPGLADRDVYLCASPGMSAAVRRALQQAGVRSGPAARRAVRAVTGSAARSIGSPDRVTDPGARVASDRPAARSDAVIAGLSACGLVVTYLLAVHTRAGQVVLDTRAMLLTGRVVAAARWTEALLTLITPTTVSLVIVLLGVLALVAKRRDGCRGRHIDRWRHRPRRHRAEGTAGSSDAPRQRGEQPPQRPRRRSGRCRRSRHSRDQPGNPPVRRTDLSHRGCADRGRHPGLEAAPAQRRHRLSDSRRRGSRDDPRDGDSPPRSGGVRQGRGGQRPGRLIAAPGGGRPDRRRVSCCQSSRPCCAPTASALARSFHDSRKFMGTGPRARRRGERQGFLSGPVPPPRDEGRTMSLARRRPRPRCPRPRPGPSRS
jgi:hypothetical protein